MARPKWMLGTGLVGVLLLSSGCFGPLVIDETADGTIQTVDLGNVLIVDQQHQRILEVDRFGSIHWIFRNYRPALVIQPRLTNGFFKRRDAKGDPEGWILLTRTSEGGGRVVWEEEKEGKPGKQEKAEEKKEAAKPEGKPKEDTSESLKRISCS